MTRHCSALIRKVNAAYIILSKIRTIQNADHYLVITIYLYLESRRDGHFIRQGVLYDFLISIFVAVLLQKKSVGQRFLKNVFFVQPRNVLLPLVYFFFLKIMSRSVFWK